MSFCATRIEAINEPTSSEKKSHSLRSFHLGNGGHSLQFYGFVFKFSYPGRVLWGFFDLELEVELFAAEDRRQIEFPKLAREAQTWPALIEIDDELHSQCAPEICEAHVRP